VGYALNFLALYVPGTVLTTLYVLLLYDSATLHSATLVSLLLHDSLSEFIAKRGSRCYTCFYDMFLIFLSSAYKGE
jgi:hypothetical protein